MTESRIPRVDAVEPSPPTSLALRWVDRDLSDSRVDLAGWIPGGAWQTEQGLSNREAADLLDLSPSTWHLYKLDPDRPLPRLVGMTCRAARRDPLVIQAHDRARKTGRPRSAGSAG